MDDVLLLLHELRNPLVGIAAAARVLSGELGPHPGAKRAAAIASEARHLLAMLESVADAEAAAAGRLRTALEPTDLAALVHECVGGLHLGGRAVTISGAEDPLVVHADPGRIRQVLTNLLMNAAQYSPDGTPIDVIVRADARGRRAAVEVHDRGPGIPAPERRKLFRKFTRLSTADGTRGSGLGLYICKAIVEEHGGTIGYTEKTFTFALPLKRSARARAVGGGRRDLGPTERSRARGAKGRTKKEGARKTAARASDRGARRGGPQPGAARARAPRTPARAPRPPTRADGT